MECQFHQHLVAYLDGELPEPLRAELEQHLPGCSACARAVEELRGTRSLLEGWAVPEPTAAARRRAFQALQRRPRPETEPVAAGVGWVRVLLRYALPLAAGVLVAVLVVSSWEREVHRAVPDELIADLPVLENLEILEAMDVLTEWENLQALAALEPTLVSENGEEVMQ